MITRLCLLTMVLGLAPLLSGFVLLSSTKATLDSTPEAPEVQFVWNGGAPVIEKKDEFKGGIYQDLDDTEFMRILLQESMDIWNSVPAAFVQMTLVDGEAETNDEDLQHSIVVASNDNVTTAAFALPRVSKDNAALIEDCDISISKEKTPAKALAITIVHELGHCLGLGHAHSNYNAIMGYSRTTTTLKLGADDIAGLVYLYPDPYYVKEDTQELIACGTVSGHSVYPSLTILMLFAGLLFPLSSLLWQSQNLRKAKARVRFKTMF